MCLFGIRREFFKISDENSNNENNIFTYLLFQWHFIFTTFFVMLQLIFFKIIGQRVFEATSGIGRMAGAVKVTSSDKVAWGSLVRPFPGMGASMMDHCISLIKEERSSVCLADTLIFETLVGRDIIVLVMITTFHLATRAECGEPVAPLTSFAPWVSAARWGGAHRESFIDLALIVVFLVGGTLILETSKRRNNWKMAGIARIVRRVNCWE